MTTAETIPSQADSGGTFSSDCRLCGSAQFVVVDHEEQAGTKYTVVRCRQCSLVYIRETKAEVSPEYTSLTDEGLTPEHIRLQTSHKRRAFHQCLDLVRSQNNVGIKGGAALLDVGCGVGGWLDEAQAFFQCYGFDASPVQIEYARRKPARVRSCGNVDDYERELSGLPKFDLITLWDVLEHIRKPREFLISLGPRLASDGYLFVSVPAATPMVVKSKLVHYGWPKNKFSWHPWEHVSYFSPRTLRQLLKETGYEVIEIGSVVVYPRAWSAYEVIRRVFFAATRLVPTISPQIYALARRR